MTTDEYYGHPAYADEPAERDDDPAEQDSWPGAWGAPWGEIRPDCPWCGRPSDDARYVLTWGRFVHLRCRGCDVEHAHPIPFPPEAIALEPEEDFS